MKFLITGSLRSSRGPRALVTLSLLLFFFFLAAHVVREAGTTGFVAGTVQKNLYGGPHDAGLSFAAPPPGFLAILEDLHMDLFFFGLLALFLGSVLYQIRLGEITKRILVYAIFLLPLAFIFSRGLSYFFFGGAYLVLPTAVGGYGSQIVAMLLILRDLYRRDPA